MTELLSILYKMRIFTLDELSEALKGKVKSVDALLARYKQQGWIVAIRRNTYCMKDIASGLPVCDKYEIGSHLSPTACISYHTALEFHGLAHQPFNEVFVKSITRFNSFSFDDVDYTYCRQTKEIVGMMTPKGNPYVRVTDVESTLLDCDRESMLSIRQEVNNEILRYMESEGFHLAPGSKTPHTLDSWVFHYTNAAGNNDGIKIEINYSDRCHILPAIETHVSIPFLSDVKVRSLSPVELFATKINALIGRSAARDIYDVYKMVVHQLFRSDEERTLLRKATVFYQTVGSSRKDNATPTEYVAFPQIDKIRFPQIRSQLLPVLRRSEHFDFEKAKIEVEDFLSQLLVLTDSEKEYVREFNDKKYIPELLFEDKEIVDRIKFHPMALWKTRSR